MGRVNYNFKIEKKSGESFTDIELLLLESVVYELPFANWRTYKSKGVYHGDFENSFGKYYFRYNKRYSNRADFGHKQIKKKEIKKTEKELELLCSTIPQEFEKLVKPLFNRYKKDNRYVKNLYEMLDNITLNSDDDDFGFTRNKRGSEFIMYGWYGENDSSDEGIEEKVRDIVKYIFRPLGFIMNGTVEVEGDNQGEFKIGVKVTDNRIKVKEVSMSDDLFD